MRIKRWLLIGLVIFAAFVGGLWLLYAVHGGGSGGLKLVWQRTFYPGGLTASTANAMEMPTEMRLVGDDRLLALPVCMEPVLFSLEGEQLWRFQPLKANECPTVIGPCSVADDGNFFIGTNKNILYAFDADGTERWHRHVSTKRDWHLSPAAASDGGVYAAVSPDTFVIFDKDGDLQVRTAVPDTKVSPAPVIAADGGCYLQSSNLEVIALGPDGKERWRSMPGIYYHTLVLASNGDIICSRGSTSDVTALDSAGQVKWSISFPYGLALPYPHSALVLTTQDQLFLFAKTAAGGTEFTAIDPNGNQQWSFQCDGGLYAQYAYDGHGHVLMVHTPGLSPQIQQGSSGWLSTLLLRAKRIFSRPKAELVVLDCQGHMLGRKQLDFMFSMTSPLVLPDGKILVLGDDGVMYCYELEE